MTEVQIDRILAVDCGSMTTTGALIDRVEGKYHLLASSHSPSTYGPPWYDITLGVQQAIRQIEKASGHTLLTPGGRPITPRTASQQGVDAFVATSSAGPPLQVVLVGLMQKFSLVSAHRAAASTYTYITRVLSLDAGENSVGPAAEKRPDWYSPEARMQMIQAGQPDVIMLVGGTDGGAEGPVIDLANVISMALQVLKETEKPAILYAGNRETRQQVAEILGPVTNLKAVDNIRPTLETENPAAAQVELENLYIQRKMFRLPGFQTLNNWASYPILPSSKSFEKVITYIGRQSNLRVLGANLGSGATVLSMYVPDYAASIIRSDAGTGHALTSFLKIIPIEKIHRWLPFELAPEELYNHLLNQSLHPHTIPTSYKELMIEYAVAREALRSALEQIQGSGPAQRNGPRDIQWNLIIGAGLTLTRAPQPAYAAMVMLDALEPWGVTSLALDTSSVANLLGAIAAVQPLAAVEVAARSAFLNLATVVAPAGHGQLNKSALNFKITYGDGRTYEVEVPYGSLEVVALPTGEKATLEMRPARHFDIGLGQPGRGALAEVEGGLLGVIIDARGRPLRLPEEDSQRQKQLEQWLANLGMITHATSRHND